MEIETVDRKGAVEVLPTGKLNIDTNSAFESDFKYLTTKSDQSIFALNLSRVSFMDSSGLGTLIRLHTLLKNEDQQFVIVDLHPELQRLFKTARLGDVLSIQTSAEFDGKYPRKQSEDQSE